MIQENSIRWGKKLLETPGKNEKAGREKKYNLILGPEMNTVCIVKIIYYVTDFNLRVSI